MHGGAAEPYTAAARSGEAGVSLAPDDTRELRPQQARSGPVLGRSHLGVSGRGERDAVSSRVPLDAGRTSALLLATSKSPVGRETRPCVRAHAGMADGSGVIAVFVQPP